MGKHGFIFGVFLSRLGDSFSFLAFILLLVGQGKSNALVSAFMVAHYGPGMVIGIYGRNLFDKVPKQKTLAATYFASAFLTLLATTQTSSATGLLLISILLGIAYGIYVPLQRSFIPEVFPAKEIKRANANIQLAEILAKTLGFALAGFVFRRVGPVYSFLIDAASFVGIAFILLRFKPQAEVAFQRAHGSIAETRRPLIFISFVFALAWFGTGTLFSLEASYAKNYLQASDDFIGLLFALATLGAFLAPRIAHAFNSRRGLSPILKASLGEMVFVAGYGLSGHAIAALVCIVGYGLLLSLRHILLANWIHLEIPGTEHGSAFAFQQGIANGAMMLGMGFSGPLSDLFGVRPVILGSAILSCALILIIRKLFQAQSTALMNPSLVS